MLLTWRKLISIFRYQSRTITVVCTRSPITNASTHAKIQIACLSSGFSNRWVIIIIIQNINKEQLRKQYTCSSACPWLCRRECGLLPNTFSLSEPPSQLFTFLPSMSDDRGFALCAAKQMIVKLSKNQIINLLLGLLTAAKGPEHR